MTRIGARAGAGRAVLARRLPSFLAWTAALFLLWLLLVGTVAWLELVAGACAAAIGAFAALVVGRAGLDRFRFELVWLARLWRPCAQIVPDFALVMAALGRRVLTGKHPSDACRAVDLGGGSGDPRSPGWRAVVSAGGSLAPNTVVIHVDRKRKRALVHELVSGPSKPL